MNWSLWHTIQVHSIMSKIIIVSLYPLYFSSSIHINCIPANLIWCPRTIQKQLEPSRKPRRCLALLRIRIYKVLNQIWTSIWWNFKIYIKRFNFNCRSKLGQTIGKTDTKEHLTWPYALATHVGLLGKKHWSWLSSSQALMYVSWLSYKRLKFCSFSLFVYSLWLDHWLDLG